MTTPKTDALMALADVYSGARAAWHVENLYGTSKRYTEQLYKEMEEARAALLAALQALDPPVEQPHLQFTAYHTDDTQAGTL